MKISECIDFNIQGILLEATLYLTISSKKRNKQQKSKSPSWIWTISGFTQKLSSSAVQLKHSDGYYFFYAVGNDPLLQSSSAPSQTPKPHTVWRSDPDGWTRISSRPPSTAPRTAGDWSKSQAPSTSACRRRIRPRTRPCAPSEQPPVSLPPEPARPACNPSLENTAAWLHVEDNAPRWRIWKWGWP